MKALEEVLKDWEAVIGLEIHAELTTLDTKMFCGCKLEHGAAPNTHTCPVCLGLPGALPVPNKAAIESIVLAGLATNCDIEKHSMFYRKNYMYPDMAKNFQTTQGPIAFCMNTERAKELKLDMPKTWMDLLKPEYAKSVRMAHPATSGTAYNMLTTLIRIYDGDEDKAFDYFKKLSASVEQFTRSGSAPGKSCAIGEIPIAIGYLHDQVKLQKEGAPIEIVIPSDGTGAETASMSILKDGPDALNAKKLYDWILGQKAMDIIASWYVIPLSSLATPSETGFSLAKMKMLKDDQWDAANKERLIERWNREISMAPEKK